MRIDIWRIATDIRRRCCPRSALGRPSRCGRMNALVD